MSSKPLAEYIVAVNEQSKASAEAEAPKLSAHGSAPLSLVVFKKFDAGEKGYWDQADFKRFTEQKQYFFTAQELAVGFIYADANSDGLISYSEFKQFWSNKERFLKMELSDEQAGMLDMILKIFTSCDKNGDGELDRSEIGMLTRFLIEGRIVMSESFLDELDANSNGKYELPEILRFLIQRGMLDPDV